MGERAETIRVELSFTRTDLKQKKEERDWGKAREVGRYDVDADAEDAFRPK